jgi:hypothetical protein
MSTDARAFKLPTDANNDPNSKSSTVIARIRLRARLRQIEHAARRGCKHGVVQTGDRVIGLRIEERQEADRLVISPRIPDENELTVVSARELKIAERVNLSESGSFCAVARFRLQSRDPSLWLPWSEWS